MITLSNDIQNHILICFSISYLVTQSRITAFLRDTGIEMIDYLFSCIMCTSFWISIIIFKIDGGSSMSIVSYVSSITSVASYVLFLIVEIIEKIMLKLNND